MTEILDGEEDQRKCSRRIFVPSPSCPLAVLLVLTARFFTYSSTRSLCSILYSMWLLLAPVPASLRLYKLASHQSPPRPALHRATKAVSLASDFGHNAVDQPSGIAVPRTYTSSSLPHQSFISRHIHGPAFSDSSCNRNRRRRRRQLVPLCILARANEGT